MPHPVKSGSVDVQAWPVVTAGDGGPTLFAGRAAWCSFSVMTNIPHDEAVADLQHAGLQVRDARQQRPWAKVVGAGEGVAPGGAHQHEAEQRGELAGRLRRQRLNGVNSLLLRGVMAEAGVRRSVHMARPIRRSPNRRRCRQPERAAVRGRNGACFKQDSTKCRQQARPQVH